MQKGITLLLFLSYCGSAVALCTYSAGIADSRVNATEQTLLNVSSATPGTLTYFWITGEDCVSTTVIRVYVDGEVAPSLTFEAHKMVGIGYLNKTHAGRDLPPWGSKWVASLGRNAYSTTMRVPYLTALRLTFQAGVGGSCAVWIQARAAEGLLLDHIIPGVTLPPSARLRLQVRENVSYTALEYMVVADVPKGASGAFFFSTMWWTALSPNTIEGCWRAFTPRDAPFNQSLQLSTGWEDYYASSWGFTAGAFQTDLAGETYWTVPANLQVSAYRFHDVDPLFFEDGLLLVLRNGETTDEEGIKCRLESGGKPFGSPSNTTFSSYAWYYTW